MRVYSTAEMSEDSELSRVSNSDIASKAPKTRAGKSRKLKTKIRVSNIRMGKMSKSKFSEYLEMEMGRGLISEEDDLRLERKLAKKLKVKNGKLGGNDELAMLLEGIPAAFDTVDGEDVLTKSLQDCPSRKKQKKSKQALEEIESQKESANMDGLPNSVDAGSDEHDDVEEPSNSKDIKDKKRKAKSTEYFEVEEIGEGVLSATKALKLQRKLKRRVKEKEGNLSRDDDDTNQVYEEIPSVVESLDNAEIQDSKQHINSSSLENIEI